MPTQTIETDVIVERLDNLKEHLTERLDRIEAQTTKTNGRVSKLEEWKNRIVGGLIITNIIVVPIIIAFAIQYFK